MYIVGLFACQDNNFNGIGVFRAYNQDIVNVSLGGTVLIPKIIK